MPTKRELEAKDPDILLERIRREFPDLVWNDYKFLNHGWDHEVIILDNKIVFRFPNSQEYLDILKDEVSLLNYLSSKLETRIPDYRYAAKDFSFAGYSLISGEELTKDVYDSLSAAEKDIIAQQIAHFLKKLHSIGDSELTPFNIAHDRAVDDFAELSERADKLLRDRLNKEDLLAVDQILEEVNGISDHQYKPVLLHADLSSSHILWDSKKSEIGIIDFSDRMFGDPALDFAELYYYGEDFVNQVFGQYDLCDDRELLLRAKIYYRRIAVFLLVDSFLTDKISFDKAKSVLERVKNIKVS